MKQIVRLLLLTGFIVSCAPRMHASKLCTAAPAGDTVIFTPENSVGLFTACTNNMQATVTKIMDSRCPKGVTCVWAGTVSVDIKLNDAVVKLGIGEETVIAQDGYDYTFQLVDVVPYPGTSSVTPTALVRIVNKGKK